MEILVRLPGFAWEFLFSALPLCFYVSLSLLSISIFKLVGLPGLQCDFYCSLSLFLCLSVCLSVCLSLSLSLTRPSISLSTPCLSLSFISLSLSLSLSLSFSLFRYLSQSNYLPIRYFLLLRRRLKFCWTLTIIYLDCFCILN
jgi:hypothetical protein